MVAIRLVVVVALGTALAGCSNNPRDAKMFGLIAGDPPPPKPFVVAARPKALGAYPAVGLTPPERKDKILAPTERDQLEADLRRAGGLPPKKKIVPPGTSTTTAPTPPPS